MALYLVHIRGEGTPALERAVFVRDGFAWAALSFGPFWLLSKGAWISALLGFAAFGLLATGLGLAGLPDLVFPAWLLTGLLIALESGSIRSWELRLKGYRDVALIAGDDREMIEHRFFSEMTAGAAQAIVPAAHMPAPTAPARAPVIGLFPAPPRGGQA